MAFPCIYSLSTVNLIFHGSRDYRFNQRCTSFTGDSGAGKSVIADLLQLILVGPHEYRSATHSKGERPPHTLVLGAKNGGNSRGLAFVNVQLNPNEFIVIGCALESATQQCIPFAVQQGTDWQNKLRSIDHPLSYDAFILEDQTVAPIEFLEGQLRAHNVVCKVFRQTAQYLRLLVKNNLVPLDITWPKQLEDFGGIIRSFARSGELDKNPKSLPSFLFGQHDQENILKMFNDVTSHIEKDQSNYQQNVIRINTITDKIKIFRRLSEQRLKARAARRAFQANLLKSAKVTRESKESQVAITSQQLQQAERCSLYLSFARTRQALTDTWAEALQYRANLRQLKGLPEQLEKAQEEVMEAHAALEVANEHARQAKTKLSIAYEVNSWLTIVSSTYDGLVERLQQFLVKGRKLECRKLLIQHLETQGQLAAISRLRWDLGISAFEIQKAWDSLKHNAQMAKRLAAYLNTDDSDSLLSWALQHPSPLNLEQESVLAHFGKFDYWRDKEERDARFLAQADALINDQMAIEEGSSPEGFWLCASGIREWIVRIKPEEQLFAKDKREGLAAEIDRLRNKTNQDLQSSVAEFELADSALNSLKEFPDWEAAIQWLAMPEADEVTLPESFPTNQNDLQAAITLHRNLPDLEEQCRLANCQAGQSNERYKINLREEIILQTNLTDLSNSTSLINRSDLTKRLIEARSNFVAATKNFHEWLDIRLETKAKALSEVRLSDGSKLAHSLSLSKLNMECEKAENKLKELAKTLNEAQEALESALLNEREAESAWASLPVIEADESSEQTVEVLTEAEVQSIEHEYKVGLGIAARKYLGEEDVSALEDLMPDYFLELFTDVMPVGLNGVLHSASEGHDRLQQALNQINETVRDIAHRKYNDLALVVAEIRKAYDRYSNQINQLKSFFRRGKVQISGGYRPWISFHESQQYPLAWVEDFKEKALVLAAAHQVEEFKTPEVLLLEAFEKHPSAKRKPKLKDILNPVNYLHLDFEMRSDDGHINDGSTGQTFMAAALLNIGRLSVFGGPSGALHGPSVLKVIAIDEADGLGSNYPNLLQIAREQSVQVISLSIRPLAYEDSGQQRLYILNPGRDKAKRLNQTPLMLSNGELCPATDPFFVPEPSLFDQSNSSLENGSD